MSEYHHLRHFLGNTRKLRLQIENHKKNVIVINKKGNNVTYQINFTI
jgi:hypothetical protein